MQMWWSCQSVSLALSVAMGLRALEGRLLALASPPAMRRMRGGLLRLVTIVAGH